jgi:DNA mismatch endonuclease, patch repair protein
MMAGIRNKDTRPEILVRKALFRRGFRYSLGGSGLPGKPDLVFKKHRAVLFVNGCFWHGHGCHLFKWPSSNREFWHEKISANISRDQVNIRACLDNGYRVATVWGCAIKGKFRQPWDKVVSDISCWLLQGDSLISVSGTNSQD